MKRNLFPYIALRRQADGSFRPRFNPGPRERALGFAGEDLRHGDGQWFNLEEVRGYADGKAEAIAASRGKGKGGELKPAAKSVSAVLDAYFASPDFRRLRPRTQRDYEVKAGAIRWQPRTHEDKRQGVRRQAEPIALAPARAVTPANVKAFYEYLAAARGQAMARGAVMVLSAAYAWARLAEGWELPVNPCMRLKLPSPATRLCIWSADEVSNFVAAADVAGLASVGDAVMIALFSGQREGDVLALVDKAGANRSLAERAADGEPLRFVQGKTGARVAVFATRELVERLAAAELRRRARLVPVVGDVAIALREENGEAWDEHAFRKAVAKIRATVAATSPAIAGKRFQDLRDTAVTWLARAGCTIPEIASITGHSLQSVTSILKHYLELGEPLAREAIRKMVEWMGREGVKL